MTNKILKFKRNATISYQGKSIVTHEMFLISLLIMSYELTCRGEFKMKQRAFKFFCARLFFKEKVNNLSIENYRYPLSQCVPAGGAHEKSFFRRQKTLYLKKQYCDLVRIDSIVRSAIRFVGLQNLSLFLASFLKSSFHFLVKIAQTKLLSHRVSRSVWQQSQSVMYVWIEYVCLFRRRECQETRSSASCFQFCVFAVYVSLFKFL